MNAGFNGQYEVTGVTSSKQFTVNITTNPGAFSNDTSNRNTFITVFQTQEISQYLLCL